MIVKLLAFTFAMIVGPIGSYFLSVNTIFKGMLISVLPLRCCPWLAFFSYADRGLGNSTYAGALAAIMANVVLIGYVIVAMREDQSDQQDGGTKEEKKNR